MKDRAIHTSSHSAGKQEHRFRRLRPAAFLLPALVLAAGVCAATPALGQQMPGPSHGLQGLDQPVNQNPLPVAPISTDSVLQQRRLRALNSERQKEMLSDADKLLKLTAELNAEVARRNSDSLTLDELHKLAKIEKLARSVRDKMSNPVQMSVFEDNFPPPPVPIGIQ